MMTHRVENQLRKSSDCVLKNPHLGQEREPTTDQVLIKGQSAKSPIYTPVVTAEDRVTSGTANW